MDFHEYYRAKLDIRLSRIEDQDTPMGGTQDSSPIMTDYVREEKTRYGCEDDDEKVFLSPLPAGVGPHPYKSFGAPTSPSKFSITAQEPLFETINTAYRFLGNKRSRAEEDQDKLSSQAPSCMNISPSSN